MTMSEVTNVIEPKVDYSEVHEDAGEHSSSSATHDAKRQISSDASLDVERQSSATALTAPPEAVSAKDVSTAAPKGKRDLPHLEDCVIDPDESDQHELKQMSSWELHRRAKSFAERCKREESLSGDCGTPKKTKTYMTGDASEFANKKGALTGVFIPTCENMWGVLIFLRFNYVVGVAGIGFALLAVLLSFIAAVTTTTSLAACVSSGGVVSRGGPYYMISRATGPSVGVSVGLMYFLGITLLAVLETLGAIETIFLYDANMHFVSWAPQIWGSGLFFLLAAIVYGGINLVTKAGIVFFIVVLYTIMSFYVGFFIANKDIQYKNTSVHLQLDANNLNWTPHFSSSVGFGDMLAVFFPCFTGILSGADRADVLRNPSRDIIRGTFCAVCVSFVMYISFMLLWGFISDSPEYLSGEYYDVLGIRTPQANLDGHRRLSSSGSDAAYVILDVPWNPVTPSIYIGIIISSCAQALQCMAVAPKLLQSISADKVIPILRWFAPLSNGNEPRRALLATYLIGACLVLLGSLDLIAPLLSMCFLVAYTYINFSCLLLTFLKAPSWRPSGMGQKRYRVGYIAASFCGIVVCVGIMFVIHYVWAMLAIILGISLHLYADWSSDKEEWGSGVHGVKFHFAMSALLSLEHHQKFQINWRPHMLILYRVNVANELRGIQNHGILKFCSQLRKSRGMCIAAAVLEGHIRDPHDLRKARSEKLIIENIMKQEKIRGFAEVVVAPTWADGANYTIQLSGLGGLTPNTVVMEWPDLKWRKRELWDTIGEEADNFVGIMCAAQAEGKALLVVKGVELFPDEVPETGNIDVWWMLHDGGLLILLSWLLRQHRMWRSCHLRIFTIMEGVSEYEAKLAALKLTATLRQRKLFNVEVDVILIDDSMIEPYTKDWTLKVETRNQLLQELHPHLQKEKKLPVELDDLFIEDKEKDKRIFSKKPSEVDCADNMRVQDERDQFFSKSLSTRHAHKFQPQASAPSNWQPREQGRGTPHVATHSMQGDFASTMGKDDPLVSISSGVTSASMSSLCDRLHRTDRGMFPVTNPLFGYSPGSVALGNVDDTNVSTLPGERLPPTETEGFGSERLNDIIKEKSANSALVLLNLPDCWGGGKEESARYLAYCDTLTMGLKRAVFVRSAGHEVFDID